MLEQISTWFVNRKKREGEGDKEEERNNKKKKMEEEEVCQERRNLDSKCIQTARHNLTLVRVISA
jgi:hypothetical protein